MAHNSQISAALADLGTQEVPNFGGTAKKYNVNRITLTRRFRKIQGTRQEAAAQCRQLLKPVQEEVLVQYIIKLTNRGTPPTPYIMKNMAEEVVKKIIGKMFDYTVELIEQCLID